MFQKIFHYVQKVIDLGPKQSSKVFFVRAKKIGNYYYWRKKTLNGNAAHNWQDIFRLFDFNNFEKFFEWQRLRSLNFIKKIYSNSKVSSQIIEEANFFIKNGVKIFNNLYCVPQINWHQDIQLAEKKIKQDTIFPSNIFYKDVIIKSGVNQNLIKDIKVPWELSRFQQLFVIGKAYKLTGDKKYVDEFVHVVSHWLDHNTYLLGVNWVCPMEVGLRAINWIVGFSLFKDANILPQFWQRFTCSLYDHVIYLENNWEIYDSRTSNHYLSDLVGYLYLCWFFKGLSGFSKKIQWVHQEIIQEMNKQVFDEGTDYEGSTHYHKLVTELFYHAYLMFTACDLDIPLDFEKKLFRMFDFIEWCTPENGKLISIGDNDSGKVLYYGLPRILRYTEQSSALRMSEEKNVLYRNKKNNGNDACFCSSLFKEGHDSSSAHPECFCERKNVSKDKNFIKHFSQFGLSIIKNKKIHISLRHHAYNAYQPSGHFHNDVGSITLAVDGIPVLVDPGSYVYTPSAYWRNKFRSVSMHNTCYVDGVEPVAFTDELFGLNIPVNQSEAGFKVKHNLYKNLGVSFVRSVNFDDLTNNVIITDEWSGASDNSLTSCWNFTLGPNITPQKEEDGWLLHYQGKTLVTLHSPELNFKVQSTWVSHGYSTKVPSVCLRAKKELCINLPISVYLLLSK